MTNSGTAHSEIVLEPSAAGPADAPRAQSPALSVIMSVYNGERFLEEAVVSVLNQTYSNFEFVIVDDGSTDGTGAILARMAAADSRLRITRQENQGIAAALNHALTLARHDLVAHIDHDDRALPNWLESQLNFFLDHSDCAVVSSHGYFINVFGKRFGKSGNAVDVERGRRELNPSLFLELMHSTVLMRRQCILAVGGYRAIMPEDRDLWGRVVTAGMMIRCNPVPLVEYRLHSASETTRKMTQLQADTRHGVDLNIVRRLQGLPELTPLEVRQHRAKRSAWQKWREHCRTTAGTNFRLAARHYSEGQPGLFAWRFSIAVANRPFHTLARARHKLSHG